jgi:hypothetical protein
MTRQINKSADAGRRLGTSTDQSVVRNTYVRKTMREFPFILIKRGRLKFVIAPKLVKPRTQKFQFIYAACCWRWWIFVCFFGNTASTNVGQLLLNLWTESPCHLQSTTVATTIMKNLSIYVDLEMTWLHRFLPSVMSQVFSCYWKHHPHSSRLR